MNFMNQNPYPLGSLPTRIYKAVLEAMQIVQTTDVIAATSALGVVSTSVGGNADWRHPGTGKTHPSTINVLVSGVSGDRKSSTDVVTCAAIHAHDQMLILQHSQASKEYDASCALWSATYQGLLSRISKLVRAGKSAEQTEVELAEHVVKKPTPPKLLRIIRQDVTHRTVFEGLEGDGKLLALMTDEGQTLLDSNVMRHLGFLNKIWDGAPLLTYDRANNDQIVVLNARATISMMVQPSVINQYLAKHGEISRGSGFWARWLIARSPSIQGFRTQTVAQSKLVDLVPFHDRVSELLKAYHEKAEKGCVIRDVLEFDDAAKQLWFQMATQVENDLKPGFYLSDISDFGSKYMDIVGRLAALMHYFEADTSELADEPHVRAEQLGKISSQTLYHAQQIAAWHMNEYKQVFSPAIQRAPEQLDGDRLYAYLYRNYFARNCLEAVKNLVRQYCGVRGSRYEPAIRELIARQAINIKYGKNKTQIIELNLNLFRANPI
jgi:hypothetical protein